MGFVTNSLMGFGSLFNPMDGNLIGNNPTNGMNMPLANNGMPLVAKPKGTFINDGTVGPTIANADMIEQPLVDDPIVDDTMVDDTIVDDTIVEEYATRSYKPGIFENTMYGLGATGSMLGGIGSLYSAYEMNDYLNKQMAMAEDAYRRNVEADEKRQQLNF